jgi:hypothetical protein
MNLKMKLLLLNLSILLSFPSILIGQINAMADSSQTKLGNSKIICLSDVSCSYPLLDSTNLNQQLKKLFLKVKAENPDFVLVGGFVNDQLGKCVINESIKHHANAYYPMWQNMIKESGLDYFTVIGPDIFGGKEFNNQKNILFNLYLDLYDNFFHMPHTGGGDKLQGKCYWYATKNVIVVVLDAYENPISIDGKLVPNISSEQLTWLENTLEGHSQYDNKMVIASTSSLLKSNKELTAILSKNKIDYFISFESDSFLKEKLYDFNVVTIPKSILPNENCQYVKFDVNKNQVDINLIEQNNTGKIPKL